MKIESFIIKIISWLVLPFSLFVSTWWGLASLKIFGILKINDISIAIFSVISIVIGFGLSMVIHNYFYINFYKFPYFYLALIYFFFSAIGFSFLMGIPVFVLILGICAGIYSGRRLSLNKLIAPDKNNHVLYFSSLITGFWVLIMCLITIYDGVFYTVIENYLGIKKVSLTGFFEIVLIFLLVILFMLIQYYLTNVSFKLFYKIGAKLNVSQRY